MKALQVLSTRLPELVRNTFVKACRTAKPEIEVIDPGGRE